MPEQNHRATLPSTDASSSFWHTEPSSLLLGHRTTRDLPQEVDVVVVGSGISGVGVVWHLLEGLRREKEEKGKDEGDKKKLDVLMLEAREVCWGATGRNGGHCQPIFYEHPYSPSIPNFEHQNFLALDHLITSLSIPCEWSTQPGIRALYSSSDLSGAIASVSKLRETAPELASHVRVITAAEEVRNLGLNEKECIGAVVTDLAARLWPYKFVTAILENIILQAEKPLELNLQTHTPVLSISASSSSSSSHPWIIDTPRGQAQTKKVVLATNAYTSYLVPEFSDLIVPVRGQMSALLPPKGLSGKQNRTKSSFGFIGESMDDYLIQRPSSAEGKLPEEEKDGEAGDGSGKREDLLMFGGGRNHGPSLGISDDGQVDANVAKYLRTAVPELLLVEEKKGTKTGPEGEEEKGKELEAKAEWTGIMGFSRDNLPWIGPLPSSSIFPSCASSSESLFVVGGYTGHGMPNAWLCSKAIANMVIGSLQGRQIDQVIEEEVQKGLPREYLLSEERFERARGMESVEVQDEGHMFKAEIVA